MLQTLVDTCRPQCLYHNGIQNGALPAFLLVLGTTKSHRGTGQGCIGDDLRHQAETYNEINRGGQSGGIPHSLSGAYLQDYASYGYETSWVDRSYQGGVQCTGTMTLACLIFELLPFVYFHT